MTKNEATVDQELFHDIIPFIKDHYAISDELKERAIAGLSMGGLQAIETGIERLTDEAVEKWRPVSEEEAAFQ